MELNMPNKLGAVLILSRNKWSTKGKKQYCVFFPRWARSIKEGHGLAIKTDTKD